MEAEQTSYILTGQERAAVMEARKQESAIEAQLFKMDAQRRKLVRQLEKLDAMRNGMLMAIAFQQGLAGNWTLTPDGSALTKE